MARSKTTFAKGNGPPLNGWKPGQSGNPKGRPTSLLESARALTKVTLDRLRYLMDHAEDERVQFDAAEIVNRGWGKPAQALAINAQNETDRVTAVQLNIVSMPPVAANMIDGEISKPPRRISIGTIRSDNSGDE